MPAYTEEEIINGCRKQSRAIQEYLYKTYYGLFLKICARYAKDMHDAEQLLNDGFLRIFTKIDQFENKGSFEGWMKRIMVNTCLDYLKSSYLKTTMKMHINAAKIEDTELAIAGNAINQIEFKELVKLIQHLPHMSRTVFNLFVFEGYSHNEISRMLDISEGTSHWHVHQARNTLKEQIKKNNSLNQLYESKRV